MGEPVSRSVPNRARLVDVATAAGVTKSVASRVLNEDPTLHIRPDTRERIVKAATRLGYRAHIGAQILAGSEARALALLIPDLANPVYTRIIRGAYERARTRGYVVLLAEDRADDGADDVFAELVKTGRVDGLLIASARPEHKLLASPRLEKIPHVFVNREVPGSTRNIGMDLVAASTLAVEHLHKRGHNRIGLVSGPESLSPARTREQGFVQAMESFGLDAGTVAHGAFTEEGGATAARHLLERHPDITAIYSSTLTQAVGMLHAIHQQHLRVPTDISVIAYDDLPLADYLDPPLTTIAMPLVELGAAAVDAVIDQLHGAPAQNVTTPTVPRVVERQSVAPITPE